MLIPAAVLPRYYYDRMTVFNALGIMPFGLNGSAWGRTICWGMVYFVYLLTNYYETMSFASGGEARQSKPSFLSRIPIIGPAFQKAGLAGGREPAPATAVSKFGSNAGPASAVETDAVRSGAAGSKVVPVDSTQVSATDSSYARGRALDSPVDECGVVCIFKRSCCCAAGVQILISILISHLCDLQPPHVVSSRTINTGGDASASTGITNRTTGLSSDRPTGMTTGRSGVPKCTHI